MSPPFSPTMSTRSRTSAFTCSGVPKGNVPCSSTVPQRVRSSPNLRFNSEGSIALGCTGWSTSTPTSINSGITGQTLPQV